MFVVLFIISIHHILLTNTKLIKHYNITLSDVFTLEYVLHT